MCGIFGVVGQQGDIPPLSQAEAIRLRDLMSARGPDEAGLLMRSHVILAHRRLAIRDPESGHQPWLNADGSVAVVFNGEIYNFQSIKNEFFFIE